MKQVFEVGTQAHLSYDDVKWQAIFGWMFDCDNFLWQ